MRGGDGDATPHPVAAARHEDWVGGRSVRGTGAMAIKFRCPGCRAKLYVPSRWRGNTIACPRCEAPAVVPAAGAEAPPGSPAHFDSPAVEASLAALGGNRHEDPFGDAPVTLPRPGRSGRTTPTPAPDRSTAAGPVVVVSKAPAAPRPRGLRTPVTLPWWAVYAYLGTLTLSIVAAFFAGFWWASVGAPGP